MLNRRLQPSMNVSRLPGYTRLEEELEADDLLRSAAVEVDFDRDEVDDEKDWIKTETMVIREGIPEKRTHWSFGHCSNWGSLDMPKLILALF